MCSQHLLKALLEQLKQILDLTTLLFDPRTAIQNTGEITCCSFNNTLSEIPETIRN